MAIPQDPNLRWSLDFLMDKLVSGRGFRILIVVGDFTRECLGLVADTSLTAPRGCRRVHVLLRHESHRHGQNKTRRIYRELSLQLRNKTPKRRVKAKLRDDRRVFRRAILTP